MMSSPFDYTEIMQASFQFGTTETVEQVLARHKERDEERDAEREATRRSTRPSIFDRHTQGQARLPRAARAPAKSQIDQVRKMFAQGGGPLPPGLAPSE